MFLLFIQTEHRTEPIHGTMTFHSTSFPNRTHSQRAHNQTGRDVSDKLLDDASKEETDARLVLPAKACMDLFYFFELISFS